jgi:outer membrane assembly lipoprotein YfgL
LGPNTALIGVRTSWNSKIGKIDFPLQAQVIGKTLFVAGSEGAVAAIDVDTGADVWRVALNTKLSAGVGADGRIAAVTTIENELVAMSAGKELWRQKLGAATLTSPLVAGDRVFVLSADRSVSAFDGASGRRLWRQTRSGDALVLGQSGVLGAVDDTLVVGLGGRLVGMNPKTGAVVWEAPVAVSRGTNEVERLVDLVAGVSRDQTNICVRAFQSAVACVDGSKGKVIWTKSAAGSTGIHGDEKMLFGTESDGKLVAWRRVDGDVQWVSERLRFRTLTAPLLVGGSLVVGDNAGNVHFLSRQDGAPLNRSLTDGSAVVAGPVLAGQTVVTVSQRGGIFGFRPE